MQITLTKCKDILWEVYWAFSGKQTKTKTAKADSLDNEYLVEL